jgi:succinate dehydrogenase / fumarate reductase flavoprotein subunit
MAVGEAGCASVHGANRLGSNSLIDLVVFGRAAAIRAGEVVDRTDRCAGANEGLVEKIMDRFDAAPRHGGTPTAELRLTRCSAPCRKTPPCSAPRKRWSRAAADRMIWKKLSDLKVTDRSMIWNSDLMETLELENLMANAITTVYGGGAQGEPRRACPRGLQGSGPL